MDINYITFILIILFAFALYYIFIFFWKKRIKGIGQKRYLELMDIGENLKNEIHTFLQKKTKVIFSFINLGTGDCYNEIKCEWLKSTIEIKGNLFSSEIDDERNDGNDSYYIKTLISQKIQLIKGIQKKEFIVDIYLHQTNHFNIILDFNKNESYSLDTVFYSNDNKLLPGKLYFEEKELILDDFGLEHMRRNCLINIDKYSLIKFINALSKLNIDDKNQIFESEDNNIFLNVRIQSKEKIESSIFLNEKMAESFKLTKSQIDLLDKFYKEIIEKYIGRYKYDKDKKIPNNIKIEFLKEVQGFAIKNDQNIINNLNQNQEKEDINLNEERIPLINEDYILRSKDSSIPKETSRLNLNFEDIEKKICLLNFGYLVVDFFQSPLDIRYPKEPSKSDLNIVEKICFLCISILSEDPLSSIISFNYFKKKTFEQHPDFSNKEKIKILCCIKSHVMNGIPKKLKLQKMIDLPEFSPYLQGELMYRKIIKNLTIKSKINFIFLQLNSGSGYDFIKKDTCYKIKMIPLVIIKSHLLAKFDDYFFSYSNSPSDEYAFFESNSQLISINEARVFQSEDIAFIEDEDNSIKICIIQLHEKGGHKKFGKKVGSPRYLITSDLELYDNFHEKNGLGGGESGFALEVILLGNVNYFNTLLKCINLNALSNYKLFTQEDGSELLDEIKKIFELNNKRIYSLGSSKMISGSSASFEGTKHVYLKRLEKDFVDNIKAEYEKYIKLK